MKPPRTIRIHRGSQSHTSLRATDSKRAGQFAGLRPSHGIDRLDRTSLIVSRETPPADPARAFGQFFCESIYLQRSSERPIPKGRHILYHSGQCQPFSISPMQRHIQRPHPIRYVPFEKGKPAIKAPNRIPSISRLIFRKLESHNCQYVLISDQNSGKCFMSREEVGNLGSTGDVTAETQKPEFQLRLLCPASSTSSAGRRGIPHHHNRCSIKMAQRWPGVSRPRWL